LKTGSVNSELSFSANSSPILKPSIEYEPTRLLPN
jgi:hypothetical protein